MESRKDRPPRRLLGVFVNDALNGLDTITGFIEAKGVGAASVDRAYRCAHSIAVNSRLLGFDQTAASADALESVLLTCRNTNGRLDDGRAAALLVDVHALPIVIREELRRSFAVESTEPLDGRIKAIVDRAHKPNPTDHS